MLSRRANREMIKGRSGSEIPRGKDQPVSPRTATEGFEQRGELGGRKRCRGFRCAQGRASYKLCRRPEPSKYSLKFDVREARRRLDLKLPSREGQKRRGLRDGADGGEGRDFLRCPRHVQEGFHQVVGIGILLIKND